jgi:pyruvate/2-oxoglutarate dehydrogenase complex dihydrolipoamide acyltransferase (E2) component
MVLATGTLLVACSGSNTPAPPQKSAAAPAPEQNPAQPAPRKAFTPRQEVAGSRENGPAPQGIDALFPRLDQRFTDADKDNDGYISRDEAQAAAPMMARNFDQIDTDHDGRLSREEVRAFLEKRFAARQGNAAQPGQPGAPAAAPPQK